MARVVAVLAIVAAIYLFWVNRGDQEQAFNSGSAMIEPGAQEGLNSRVSTSPHPTEPGYGESPPTVPRQRREADFFYLNGQITDEEENPLSGATITLFASRKPFPFLNFIDPVATTNSKEGGFYELSADPPVSGWILVEKPGFASVEESVGPEQAGVLVRDYVLAAAPGAVTGRVTDTNGEPIEEAAVFISFPQIAVPDDNSQISSRVALTNAYGEFAMSNIPLREVALIASARGFLSEGRVVNLGVEEDALLEFVLEKGRIVRLQVRDPDGRPVPFPSARGPSALPSSGDEGGGLDLTLPLDSTRQWEIAASRSIPL